MTEKKTVTKISPEGNAKSIRKLNETLSNGALDLLMSFYAEDALLVSPFGKFQGKDAIKLNWAGIFKKWQNLTSTETDFGVIAIGNKVASEHIIEGNVGETKVSIPIACLYEFRGEKIQLHKMSFDRLLFAKQAAKGWLPKRLIGSIESQMAKG